MRFAVVNYVDLNADLGEGFGHWTLGDDNALLEVITSANIACGFHAGDPKTMRRVCEQALARDVRIGAQVGYRDLAGFGRRAMNIASDDLQADILYQLSALDGFARLAGDRVRYLKPHGALYNTAMVDERQAVAIADAVLVYSSDLPILGMANSALQQAAIDRSIPFIREAFADRAYTPDGQLVDRSEPGAVITDQAAVIEQARTHARDQSTQSLCVHGDTPGAVALAQAVRTALTNAGIELRSFC
jgi:UPF0271 protein